MSSTEHVKDLIEEANSRNSFAKEYEKMTIEQLSHELRDALKFEQETIRKIEEFEKNGMQEDLIKYAKVVCGNTTQREISAIQEVYFEKLDKDYLNGK